MDHTIDALRWITVAEEEVCDVDGALNALGACQTREGIVAHGFAGLDAQCVVTHLMLLSSRLQTVASNLGYLADHADLSGVVDSLQINSGDTNPAITTTQNPPAGAPGCANISQVDLRDSK